MKSNKYKMRVVRGAFEDKSMLDKLGANLIENFERDEWEGIYELLADLNQIKELQNNMVHHFDDKSVPWYMDGYGAEDNDDVIVAFGADDGEGGKIFEFRKDDKATIKKVVDYGISKGIPAEQMDFMEIKF